VPKFNNDPLDRLEAFILMNQAAVELKRAANVRVMQKTSHGEGGCICDVSRWLIVYDTNRAIFLNERQA
jgi:hypothetical protein